MKQNQKNGWAGLLIAGLLTIVVGVAFAIGTRDLTGLESPRDISATRNVTIAGTLDVTGASSFTGAVTIPDGTVTTDKIGDGAVTTSKLHIDALDDSSKRGSFADITSAGDLSMPKDGNIVASGTDGNDTGDLCITAGGACSSTRGGYLDMHGNEDAQTGIAELSAGNVSGGVVRFNTNGATRVTVGYNGGIQFFSGDIATLKAITPLIVGQTFYCSDCTLAGGRNIVSTGTAAGEFADADGSDWD